MILQTNHRPKWLTNPNIHEFQVVLNGGSQRMTFYGTLARMKNPRMTVQAQLALL